MRKAWVFALAVCLVLASLAYLQRRPVEHAYRIPDPKAPPLRPVDFDAGPEAIVAVEASNVEEADEGETASTERKFTRPWSVDALVKISRLQNEDGSWGKGSAFLGGKRLDQTGLTALTLFALISQGYSHLSKDVYDDVCLGTSIKNRLKWLLSRQTESGSFSTGDSHDLNEILAALALSEAYGMTASNFLKEPVQGAYDALARRFPSGSGWKDESVAAWAALAIWSGLESELNIQDSLVYLNQYYLQSWIDGSSRPFAKAGLGLLQCGRRVQPDLRHEAVALLGSRQDVTELERGFFESIVIAKGAGRDEPQEAEARDSRWHALHDYCVSERVETIYMEAFPDDYLVETNLQVLNLSVSWQFGTVSR